MQFFSMDGRFLSVSRKKQMNRQNSAISVSFTNIMIRWAVNILPIDRCLSVRKML